MDTLTRILISSSLLSTKAFRIVDEHFLFTYLFEHVFQENYYWLDKILHSYQSRVYAGDAGTSFEVSDYCNVMKCHVS